MRILNIMQSLGPEFGGPVEGANRLAAAWREAGHSVHFVTADSPAAGYVANAPEVTGLGYFGLGSDAGARHRLAKRFSYAPKMVEWLRSNVAAFDVVVVHGLWNYTTVAARRALVESTTPFFVFPHGCLDPWFARTYPRKDLAKKITWRFNEGPLLAAAQAVFFTTEEEVHLAENSYRPYRLTPAVVGFGSAEDDGPAAPQKSAFRSHLPALGNRPFLLFLSRIHPKKGCDNLIMAFARIAQDHPNLQIVIAGPDQTNWQPELEALADKFGVAERIHWTGMIGGDLKWGAYRAADAFILPSHSENFGVVVAEALSCGTPVLITDKVNLWREVASEDAGFVEDDTVEGTERLMRHFLALDDAERGKMQRSARQCFERHFRFDATVKSTLQHFEMATHDVDHH